MSHPGVEEVGEKNKMRYLIDWAFFFSFLFSSFEGQGGKDSAFMM